MMTIVAARQGFTLELHTDQQFEGRFKGLGLEAVLDEVLLMTWFTDTV
jgi:hypothetical protein